MKSIQVYDVESITYNDIPLSKLLTIKVGNTHIEITGNYKIKFLEHIDDFFPKVKQVDIKIEEDWFLFTYYTVKIDDYKVYVYKNSNIKVFNSKETLLDKSI